MPLPTYYAEVVHVQQGNKQETDNKLNELIENVPKYTIMNK